MSSIDNADQQDGSGWLPSVYYAETLIACALENAWELMLDTLAWNPGLAGATTTRVCGEPNCEGEVLLMNPLDGSGAPLPPFYARTITAVPYRRIAWYCYPKLDDAFRIFLEFELVEAQAGVRFSVHWYALDRLPIQALAEHRKASQATVQSLGVALKAYCEAQPQEPAEGSRAAGRIP